MPSTRGVTPTLFLGVLVFLAVVGFAVNAQEKVPQQKPEDGLGDKTPRLAIHFADGGPGAGGRALNNAMTFGLVVVNAMDPKDNGKKLVYDKHGQSNSTVVLIDKQAKVFGGVGQGNWVVKADAPGGKWQGKKSIWKFDNQIVVTQVVELVPGEPIPNGKGELKRYLDTCRVRYLLENKDTKAHKVGLRILIDTLIGMDESNDGVPFLVPGKKYLIRDFYDAASERGDPIPDFIQVLEAPNLKKPGIVGFFNLKLGGDLEAPTRVSLTRWQQIKMTSWDFPIMPIGDDSAVVIYWKDADLKPGQKRKSASATVWGTWPTRTVIWPLLLVASSNRVRN